MIPAGTMQQKDLDGDNTADQCPHEWVRNRSNGYVTGDLFEEVKPGLYAYRGRNDDWIKTGRDHFFCDTKTFEDNVLRVCQDLIRNCVVVGNYKPVVVLLVEPVDVSFNYEISSDALKAVILQRITLPFNERLFPMSKSWILLAL
ncbi:hypothetical protein C8J56DRAFT_1063654 [Mycena floridula]|nr:hypothetical protein C8J56DRAFT_1063654 [Mycena floridula]